MRGPAWIGAAFSGIVTFHAIAGPEVEGIRSIRFEGGSAVVRIADSMRREPSAIWIPGVPLPDASAIDLALEPFHVATDATRVVRGRLGADDEPIDFDPRGIAFYRGTVPGLAGSSVYLSIGPSATVGTIDLGPGRGVYGISSKPGRSVELEPGEAAIFRRTDAGGSALPPVQIGRAHV